MVHSPAVVLTLALAGGASAAIPSDAFDRASQLNREGQVVAPSPVEQASPSSALWNTPWLAMCFAPGTDEAYMDAMYQWVLANSNRGENGERYFADASWNSGIDAVGTPIFRTYSFPSDTLGGIDNNNTTQNVLNQRFVQWFGSVGTGQDKVREVFDRWEQVAGVHYTMVNDDNAQWGSTGNSSRGDLRIVSVNIDGPSGTLAYNYFPTNGDMVLDSTESYQSASNNFRFFRNVVGHENGHGMGLAHSCPQNSTKLMEPGLNTNFDGPRLDDIRGMQRNYGDNFEPNDTPGTAPSLGQLSGALAIHYRSLDNGVGGPFNDDVDYVRFVLATAGTLSVGVEPTGVPIPPFPAANPYQNGPQSGGCTVNQTVVPMEILDLTLELLAADGSTVLATANANGLGLGESIVAFDIATGGTFYVRVSTASTLQEIQLYSLNLNFVGGGCPGDTNGDNLVNFEDLNNVLTDYNQSGAFLSGDVNDDGICNFDDLNIVLSFYNQVC